MNISSPFKKKEQKSERLQQLEEEMNLIECELQVRYMEMVDLNYKDNAEQLEKLAKHVTELQGKYNELVKVRAEIERERTKPLVSPDTAVKILGACGTMFMVYLIERDGPIDRVIEKFIPTRF